MKNAARYALSLACLFSASISFAWVDTGHMVIAAVAQRDLKAPVLKEANRLLLVGGTARTDNFLTSACWADDVRNDRRESAPWHYTNIHFRQDGKRVTMKPDPENVVVAIERFSKVLADRTLPDLQRADALRFLIHFIGDLHQPLHATARDSDAFPRGDRGGNDFKIQPPTNLGSSTRSPNNLHSLWDLGCGLFPSVARPLSVDGQRAVLAQAESLRAALPRRTLKAASESNPNKWAQESFKDAKDWVYALPEGTVPSDSYLSLGREIASRRTTLAGYRLADLLNRLLGS